MTATKYHQTLKLLLRFWSVYMLLQAIIHLTNIRLYNLGQFWPKAAVLFLEEFMLLWGMSSLFLSFLAHTFVTNYSQIKSIIPSFRYLLVTQSLILLYISRNPLDQFLPTESAKLWIPHYQYWLRIEAVLVLCLFILIQWGVHKNFFIKR